MSTYGLPFLHGLKAILDGDNNMGETYKVALMKSTYVFDAKTQFFDTGNDDTNDPSFHEADCTGYVKGYGNAGRKSVTFTGAVDSSEDWLQYALSDVAWTTLGGGSGATNNSLAGMLIIREGSSDDTTSKLFWYIPFNATTTNGGAFDPQERAVGDGGSIVFLGADPPTAWVNNT